MKQNKYMEFKSNNDNPTKYEHIVGICQGTKKIIYTLVLAEGYELCLPLGSDWIKAGIIRKVPEKTIKEKAHELLDEFLTKKKQNETR